MNILSKNNFENNCLTLACKKNPNLEIIKYLIETCKMDVMYKNKCKSNCLILSCGSNKNISIIKYLIEVQKINPNLVSENNYNCLIKSAMNPCLDIIKYLIEDLLMDVNHHTIYNDNCLMICFWSNTNINVLWYLLKYLKLNVKIHDTFGNDYLLCACWCNNNLEYIKYLIEVEGMDKNQCNDKQENCLMLACKNNKNIAIIKYLIEECKMTITYSCLKLACEYNKNLNIIKYLIEKCNIKISEFEYNGSNCILFASYNKNPRIIQWLIEECDINVDSGTYNNINYIDNSMRFFKNPMTVKYLIEQTNARILLDNVEFDIFIKIVPYITNNYHRLNNLLIEGFKTYKVQCYNVINSINPLMLNNEVCDILKINPYNDPYVKFIKNVNNLTCIIPQQINISNILHTNLSEKNLSEYHGKKLIDYRKRSEILFKNDNKIYYGSRKVVYNSIILLNDINEYDLTEPIELSVCDHIPFYLMNIYINSCYQVNFNMIIIKTNDFIQFLKLIDQYPTKILSIHLLQKDLIIYMNKNKIQPNEFINNMCAKYQLKYMYLYLRQNHQ